MTKPKSSITVISTTCLNSDLKSIVHVHKPDILLLSDAHGIIKYLRLERVLSEYFKYSSQIPIRKFFKIKNSGLILYSKLPITNEYFIEFQAGKPSITTMGLQFCTVNKLTFVNSNFKLIKEKGVYQKAIKTISKRLKHYVNPNHIISIDFNHFFDKSIIRNDSEFIAVTNKIQNNSKLFLTKRNSHISSENVMYIDNDTILTEFSFPVVLPSDL